ncbi:MAG: NAD(P)/FAD-dependent oxidoreductase [Candidatus Omnitrophica bacterium]|nr:NAD(P)/FAD-dependent oxidoreductase [Candidatus Omnitrophota bacterium]
MNNKIDKLTVIGSGIAGSSFLEAIAGSGQKIDITLIDKNDFYFPKNRISKDLTDLKQVKKNDQLAKGLGIKFICAKVEKINQKRKKIYLDNSQKLEFENLIIASGSSNKKIEVKGTRKEGFFYLAEVNPFLLKVLLKIHDEAVLFVDSLEGVKFSLLLRSLQKEVKIVATNLEFLGQDQQEIENLLEQKGIVLYLGYNLKEVIGEKSVKAVKIVKNAIDNSLDEENLPIKVFSSQLVFIDSILHPNLSFLEDLEINLEKKDFFLNYDAIYVIGDAGKLDIKNQKCYATNSLRAKNEGVALANYFLGSGISNFSLENQENIENVMKKEIQDIYDKEG